MNIFFFSITPQNDNVFIITSSRKLSNPVSCQMIMRREKGGKDRRGDEMGDDDVGYEMEGDKMTGNER